MQSLKNTEQAINITVGPLVSILLIPIPILFLSTLAVSTESTKTDESLIDWLAAKTDLVGVIAIFVTLVLYWWQQRDDLKSKIQRSCQTLSTELDDTINALKGQNNIITYPTTTKDKLFQIKFTNRYLNVSAFEGIVNSGLLTYFDQGIQGFLVNFYLEIKLHNQLVEYRGKYEDMFFLYDGGSQRIKKWWDKIKRCDILLTDIETKIIDQYDLVKDSLKLEQDYRKLFGVYKTRNRKHTLLDVIAKHNA